MKPDASNLLPFLKGVPLFADLNDATLQVLARVSYLKQVPQGAVLFSQDDPGEAAYLVRSGAISIVLSTTDGRELVINEMRTGDCFGELALLTGQPHSASAIARAASQIVVIPHAEFLRDLSAEPTLMRQMLTTLARRLYASTERESALAFLDAPARLARVLSELDRADAAQGYVTISQEEISQRIGITRQTTAKILGQWRRAGWIITGRGKIVVLNRAALRKRAQEIFATATQPNSIA